MSFHVSRHVFASQVCLSQGVPIESVSKMLGHTDISTTRGTRTLTVKKSAAT
ncbi:MAG: tyrosine-type recombinase/integrase [Dysgonamonadaceae bacterium]|nr:tyrosine-type recombinase/integrase [Dysgonamonadaceae bacterium]